MDTPIQVQVIDTFGDGLGAWDLKDPIAIKFFEKVIRLCDEHNIHSDYYYRAHGKLIEIYDYLGKKPQADDYRHRLDKLVKETV